MSQKVSWNSPLGCIIALVLIAVFLGVWFGVTSGIVWLIQYAVAGMFAHQLPFWPTFAAVFIVQLLFSGPAASRK